MLSYSSFAVKTASPRQACSLTQTLLFPLGCISAVPNYSFSCLRLPARSLAVTSKQKGDALEMQVERILRREGHWRVRRNIELRDSHGNRSQIDVMYGLLRRRYVECKNYASDNKVPLDDVAKFKEVLRLNGISPSRGLFVTTSSFTPRALTTGIRTIDGDQLKAWERSSRRGAAMRSVWRFALWVLAPAASLVLLAAPYWQDLRLPGFDHPAMQRVLEARASVLAAIGGIADAAARRDWDGLLNAVHAWWTGLLGGSSARPGTSRSDGTNRV